MRPLRTVVITAALRRTTQRSVFGGGRSSLIARASGGDCSRGLVTGPRQDLGGQERLVARLGLLPAGLTVRCRMAVPRDPIDGAGCGRIGSAPAVGRRVIKAATAASMFLAIHLNVPNRAWSVSAMPSLRSTLLN